VLWHCIGGIAWGSSIWIIEQGRYNQALRKNTRQNK